MVLLNVWLSRAHMAKQHCTHVKSRVGPWQEHREKLQSGADYLVAIADEHRTHRSGIGSCCRQ